MVILKRLHHVRTKEIYFNVQVELSFYQGRAVVSPYVGMARKQDGGFNGCTNTAITQVLHAFKHLPVVSEGYSGQQECLYRP